MYVDDICLISDYDSQLQSMLNLADSYANKWLYSFNPDKSVILVLGESPASRQLSQSNRSFMLAGKQLSEVDSAKHLGILLSASASHINRATQVCSSFRSAFLALASIGTRYSQLNPTTSLYLINSFCLPILTFSFGIWSPPKSVITILERTWTKCLRTILGLPSHAPTVGVHLLLGSLPVEFILSKSRLCLMMNILCLPTSAPARGILIYRLQHQSDSPSPLLTAIISDLDHFDLPDLQSLVSNPNQQSTKPWKCIVKASLYLSWQDLANSSPSSRLSEISRFDFSSLLLQLKPLPSIAALRQAPSLSYSLSYRLRLLLHCSDLNGHTYVP